MDQAYNNPPVLTPTPADPQQPPQPQQPVPPVPAGAPQAAGAEPQQPSAGTPATQQPTAAPADTSWQDQSDSQLDKAYAASFRNGEADTPTTPAGDTTPLTEPQPKRTIFGTVKSILAGTAHIIGSPIQDTKSILRGGIDAGEGAIATSTDLAAAALHATGLGKMLMGDQWEQYYEQNGAKGFGNQVRATIDTPKNTILTSDGTQSQQFLEDTSNFITGMAALGGATVGGAALKEAGGIVGSAALRAAVVSGVDYDPYKAQLAELAANTHIPGLAQVGQLLSVHDDDGPLAATIKRGLMGILPGAAIDGLVAGARAIRLSAAGDALGASEQHAIVQNVQDGTHVPNDPLVVKPVDGGWQMQPNADYAPADGEPTVTLPPEVHTANTPAFPVRADAERVTAIANKGLYDQAYGSAPVTRVDADAIQDAVSKLDAGDPQALIHSLQQEPLGFTNADTPERAQALGALVSKHLQPVLDEAASRDPQTWAQSLDKARTAAGMLPADDLETHLDTQAASIVNSAQTQLLLDKSVQVAQDGVAQASRVAEASNGDPLALKQLDDAVQTWGQKVTRASQARSGQGLGLQILNMADRGNAVGDLDQAASDLPETPATPADHTAGILERMSPEDRRQLGTLFQMTDQPLILRDAVSSGLDAFQRSEEYAKLGMPTKAWNGFLEYLVNGAISHPATWGGIAFSNGSRGIYEDGIRMAAGTVTGNESMVQQAADVLVGRRVYLKQSLKYMQMALKSGQSIIDPHPPLQAIPGLPGEIVRSYGNRPVAAVDEFGRANGYFASVRATALAAARKTAATMGLQGDALDNYLNTQADAAVKASVNPDGSARLQEPLDYARQGTFLGPLDQNSFGRWLQQGLNKFPILKPVDLFIRASANITNYGMVQNSPLGLLWDDTRKLIASGTPEGAVAATRMATGTSLWAAAGALALDGTITGNGPADPKTRATWLDDPNNVPYSVKVGNQRIVYKRAEPWSTMMGTMADVTQAIRDNPTDGSLVSEGHNALYATLVGISSAISNKTFMEGPVHFLNAAFGNDPYAVKSWMNEQTQALIPGFADLFNNDPVMRQVQSMSDAFLAKVPGWSKTLPAKYDAFGNPVMMRPNRQSRAANPFPVQSGTGTDNTIESHILAMGKDLPANPSIETYGQTSVNLNDRQWKNEANPSSTNTPYERWMELIRQSGLRGQVADQMNDDLQNPDAGSSSGFSGGLAYTNARKIMDKTTEGARQEMLSEYPKLQQTITALNMARRISGKSSSATQGLMSSIPNLGTP